MRGNRVCHLKILLFEILIILSWLFFKKQKNQEESYCLKKKILIEKPAPAGDHLSV